MHLYKKGQIEKSSSVLSPTIAGYSETTPNEISLTNDLKEGLIANYSISFHYCNDEFAHERGHGKKALQLNRVIGVRMSHLYRI